MTILLKPSKDVALLDELDAEIFPIDDPAEKVAEGQFWYVAWDGDAAIGFAGVKILDSGIAYLNRAGIVENYRGLGLQKRMIQVRERRARLEGSDTVITYTERHNYASANNLISCGYKIYRPQYSYGLANALYFKKILD